MLTFLPLVKPREGLTVAQSHEHLRYEHARIVSSEVEFNRHMPKYVQNFALAQGLGPNRTLTTDYSSVAECVFHSLHGFWEAFAEPCYAKLREDEQRFAAFDGLLLVAAAPSRIFGPADDTPYKLWRFGTLRDGLDADEGRDFWETSYAAAVAGEERLRVVLTSYVQDRQIRGFTHNFPASRSCDVTDEFWIESLDVLPEFLSAEAELRERNGYNDRFDLEAEIQFVAEAKVLWDLGEDPRTGLSRIKRWE